ncbi:MAG: hypothetical protein ACXWDL_04820 [Nocardioides sp.]
MTVLRVVEALLLALFGALIAVAAVVVHELWWGLPWATATLVAVLVWVGRGWLTRLPLALGFVVVIGLAGRPRPEGDYLVSASSHGYLLLLLALATLLVAVVTLPRPRRVPRSKTVGGTT